MTIVETVVTVRGIALTITQKLLIVRVTAKVVEVAVGVTADAEVEIVGVADAEAVEEIKNKQNKLKRHVTAGFLTTGLSAFK
jgi:hypothetical protein